MSQNVKKKLNVGGKDYSIFSLKEAKKLGLSNIDKLSKEFKGFNGKPFKKERCHKCKVV